DRGVKRVADLPFLIIARPFPCPVGGDALCDGGHGQIVTDPDPKLACHRGDTVDAYALCQFVIVNVAGMFEAVNGVDHTMAAPAPAVETSPGDLNIARAIKARTGGDHPCL